MRDVRSLVHGVDRLSEEDSSNDASEFQLITLSNQQQHEFAMLPKTQQQTNNHQNNQTNNQHAAQGNGAFHRTLQFARRLSQL